MFPVARNVTEKIVAIKKTIKSGRVLHISLIRLFIIYVNLVCYFNVYIA